MKVKVTCKNCGLIFEKSNSEVKRSEKFNRNHFCSRVCVGTYSSNWYNPNKKYYEISKHCFNRNDEYTKFRYHFRDIKKRDKEVGVSRGINLMKSNNSDDIVWEMCKMIYENYKKINHSK